MIASSTLLTRAMTDGRDRLTVVLVESPLSLTPLLPSPLLHRREIRVI